MASAFPPFFSSDEQQTADVDEVGGTAAFVGVSDEDYTSKRISNYVRKFGKLGEAFNGELAQTRGDGFFFAVLRKPG